MYNTSPDPNSLQGRLQIKTLKMLQDYFIEHLYENRNYEALAMLGAMLDFTKVIYKELLGAEGAAELFYNRADELAVEAPVHDITKWQEN